MGMLTMQMGKIALVAVVAGLGCATAPSREVDSRSGLAPVLRLLEISPDDGSRVDSTTVLTAKLAYHIPEYLPGSRYVVAAVFAGIQGGMFNRGGGHAEIHSPSGIVTLRHSLTSLWSAGPQRPTMPLTGTFFLLQHDGTSTDADTTYLGNSMRVVRVTGPSAVRARSRTFYFNAGGPERSFAAGVPDLLEEYWTYRDHKALAIAQDSSSWTYGYAWGHSSREGAIERALRECRAAAERRGLKATCQIIAVDSDGNTAKAQERH